MTEQTKFVRPGLSTRALNRVVLIGHRAGLSVAGSRTLTVVGRRSGIPRSTPVNPLRIGADRYIVAPRGTTEWVRNLRVAGRGTLAGRGRVVRFEADEVPTGERLPILKVYLRKWAWEVGAFFDLPKHPTDAQIEAVAPLHPVFRIRAVSPDPRGLP